MKNFLKLLFNDNNSINEKSVVGYIAFVMMVLISLAEVISGFFGLELKISEFIFNSFLWLVLGSFGIGSVDKWIIRTNPDKTEET